MSLYTHCDITTALTVVAAISPMLGMGRRTPPNVDRQVLSRLTADS
jgi:hypothetical protein